MDDLLNEHARCRPELRGGGLCLPAWRVMLDARRDREGLRRWWAGHGSSCEACRSVIGRVGEAAALLDVPRVLRVFGSPGGQLAWAAASDWIDPHSPLPRVTFRRIDAEHGTDLESVWCISCDERLLLLLCGAELEGWRDGVRMHRDDGGPAIDFVPADGPTRSAFCPHGRFRGAPALCLVGREPIAVLAETVVTLRGVARGRLRLELLREAEDHGDDELLDLVQRNRVTRFLRAFGDDAPEADQRAAYEFYLRLLLQQKRVPQDERERLRGVSWLEADLRKALETGT